MIILNHLGMETTEEHLLPFSLVISSSISLPSKQIKLLLLTLCSELVGLLAARGEPETLTVLPLAGPDLTLYTEDADTFVIDGLKLFGTLRLISCIYKDTLRNLKQG